MKILVYSINYPPELTGAGKYTGEMVEWLVHAGHDVRVVTAPPYYPDWKIKDGYSAYKYKSEEIDGAIVFRSPLWLPKNVNGLKRILHLLSFSVTSFIPLIYNLFWRPNIIWLVAPSLVCSPAVLLSARLSGAKSWIHIQDYEVDAAFGLGLLKGEKLKKFFVSIESRLLRKFDRVSTISGKMMQLARAKGVADGRIKFFPNWVDLSVVKPLLKDSIYREKLNIPVGAFVALYSGNMAEKQGLELLGDVARLMQKDKGLFFVFCGNGVGKSELERQCEGFENVIFLNLQPLDMLSELLGLADVHLLPQRENAADLVMPSKLTGMLASGRPIVASARLLTEVALVVREVGIVVPPEDPDALVAAIRELFASKEKRIALGCAARCFAELKLNRSDIMCKFEADMHACVGESN